MGALRAEGDMMGKALKGKGNAERVERRGLESLDTDEETKAGCVRVLGAPVVGGTRIWP